MLREVPMALAERSAESSLPPGGGMVIALGGSLLFWAALVWLVL